jgi:branched-chain amino acid transport system ATP-binding protein
VTAEALLEVGDVYAGYGTVEVLHGIGLSIAPGDALGLLGRNGMGKTTLLRAILGLAPRMTGKVRFAGERVDGWPAHRIARVGVGFVPEGREVFPTLSVRENLSATAANRRGDSNPWTLDRVLDLLPQLRSRLHAMGSELSGGEQQMVAIGRALMTNPRLLILDEATEGLAPAIRKEVWRCLAALRARGLAIVVVDRQLAALAELADFYVVLEKGRVAWSGSPAEFARTPDTALRYLGV